ncbi:hypothetical protein GCM10010343_04490 [Streptomyces avidinii]|nr:hypothetical protein GCM10010343_04490 [Streptomyces avidinii]
MLKLNTGVKPQSVGQGAIGTERPGVLVQGSLRLGGALGCACAYETRLHVNRTLRPKVSLAGRCPRPASGRRLV